MKLLLMPLALLVLLTLPAHAQMWVEAEKTPAQFSDGIYDATGNRYVIGSFVGNLTFGSITLTSTSILYNDIYFVKYDPAGNVIWAKSAGGNKHDYVSDVNVDSAGNVLIAGTIYSDTANFSGISLTNAGFMDAFIAKYDANGNILWAKRAGGTGHDNWGRIAFDHTGNIYFTGQFWGVANFNGITLTSPGGGWHIFIVKYDPNGNILWAKSAGGISNNQDIIQSIDIDASGNIYFTGFYTGTVYFDTINLTSSGNYDVFIAKYTPNGNVLWAKSAGGLNQDWVSSIAVDSAGYAYITGYFSGQIANFSGIYLPINPNSPSNEKIFIAKYDPAGNILWAKDASGNSFSSSNAITIDSVGNAYITGGFNGSLTFGNTILITSNWITKDIFVAKYDLNGNNVWALQAGGQGNDEANIINLKGPNFIEIMGTHAYPASFGTLGLTSGNSCRAVIDQTLSTINPGIFSHNILTLFPNPNAGSFVIAGVQAGEQIIIRDIIGKTVLQQTAFENQSIQLPAGAKGLYFVQVGKRAVQKVVVE